MNGTVSGDGETRVRLQAWREMLAHATIPQSQAGCQGRRSGRDGSGAAAPHGTLRPGTLRPRQLLHRWARVDAGGSPHCAHKPAMALATAMEMKENQTYGSKASTDTVTAFWGAADLVHIPHPP